MTPVGVWSFSWYHWIQYGTPVGIASILIYSVFYLILSPPYFVDKSNYYLYDSWHSSRDCMSYYHFWMKTSLSFCQTGGYFMYYFAEDKNREMITPICNPNWQKGGREGLTAIDTCDFWRRIFTFVLRRLNFCFQSPPLRRLCSHGNKHSYFLFHIFGRCSNENNLIYSR